jgi:hypothetical protein
MSEPLELVVHSTGFEHANDMLTKIAASSAATERATDRLAAHMEAAAEREVAAAARAEASAKAAAARAEASAKAAAARMQQTQDQAARQAIEGVKKALMTQEQIVRQSENERRRIILTATQITEAQRRELLVLSATKTAAELKGINGAGGGMGMMGGMLGMAAVAGAGLGVAKFVGVTREFNRISAGLETATGSAKKADIAFEALSDFAQKTPYSLRETTDSFVKLVNFGLTPSERALTSYGDASAALGRNLNQMIEAVADATVGEFERLKEFGVKARVQGDNINFTFRGMSTTVKNNATDIEEYLIRLGEINFAGAMAKRMNTLDGALSNLGDSFDKLMRTIANAGFEDVLARWTRGLSGLMDGISDFIKKQHEFEAEQAKKGRDVPGSEAPNFDGGLLGNWWRSWSTNKGDLIDTDKDDIKRSNDIRSSEQKEKDILAQSGVEKSKILAGRYRDALDKQAENLRTGVEKLEDEYRKGKKVIEAGMLVDPAKAEDNLRRLKEKFDKDIKGLKKKGAKKDPTSKDAMGFADIEYMRKRDEDAAYRKEVEDYENDSPKVLEGLMGASEKNPTQALLERLERETAAEQKAAEDKKRMHDDVMTTFLDDNAKMLEDERRKMEEFQRLRDEDVINADELQQLKVQLHSETNKKLNALELSRVQQSTQSAELLFGNLATASKNWGGEQSGIYKTMFAAQQAFGIASATANMALSISNASAASPWQAKVPLMIQAAADGARIVAMMSSVQYSGTHDHGGSIPAGQVGLIRGPELVRGPVDVTSRADTAKILDGGGRSSAPQVHLNFDPHEAVNSYLSSTRGVDTLNVHVRKNWRNIRVASGRT